MSNFIYDFLTESFLFDQYSIDTRFAKFSDADIEKMLANYREYVLNNSEAINAEVAGNKEELSIQTESFNTFLPSENLLKQLSLYMDKALINDPLFELTRIESEHSQVANQYFGMEDRGIDRKKLSEAINYMKTATPMVAGKFVKFIPMSHIHEPPSEIPIYHSQNYFADALPKDLLEWFRKHVQVKPLYKGDNYWYSTKENLSKPCRSIVIAFKGHTSPGFIYFLFDVEVISSNDTTREVTFRQWLPDEPPEQSRFEAWIFQSVNRSAERFYKSLISELKTSISFGSIYLTTSPFTSELLNLNLASEHHFETDIADLVLDLEIPIVKETSAQALMEVRQDERVFHNFRTELARQLKELRSIQDPATLKKKLENVGHELTGVQLNQIKNKLNEIRRSAFGDSALLIVSLATTIIPNNGLNLLGALAALAKGYKDYNKYLSEIRQNPCYFLWKLEKNK